MTTNPQPSIYVDKFYAAHDEYEVILFGSALRNGMIVMIEDMTMREDPPSPDRTDASARYQQARADESSRWCEVTQLQRRGEIVQFVGKYPDGTSRVRSYNECYAWIVKRGSLSSEGQ